jgi:hypothetical protein
MKIVVLTVSVRSDIFFCIDIDSAFVLAALRDHQIYG